MKKTTLLSLALLACGAGSVYAQAPARVMAMPKAHFEQPARPADDGGEVYSYPDYSGDTFTLLGEGTFRDEMLAPYFGYAPEVHYCDIEESVEHPGVYRLVEPYKDTRITQYELQPETSPYMYIDASDPNEVYIQYFLTGAICTSTITETDPETGMTTTREVREEVKIGSMAGDCFCRYGSISGRYEARDNNYFGKLNHGNITFPNGTLLVASQSVENRKLWDTDMLYIPVNKNGMTLITLPDAPDLNGSVRVGQLSQAADGTLSVPVSATFSSDCTEARVTLVKGDYNGKAAEEVYQQLAGGTCDYQTVTRQQVTGNQNIVYFPFDGTSVYTAFMVTLDGEEQMATFYHSRELRDEKDWTSFGDQYADYTETFLSDNDPIHDPRAGWTGWMEPRTRQVVVEQNNENKGILRLVNPYTGEAPTYYEYSNNQYPYDNDRFYYMVFDITNPDRVMLRTTEDGIGLLVLNNKVLVSSRAYRYQTLGGPIYNEIDDRWDWGIWTEDMVTEEGLWGKYDNETKTITFPAQALSVNFKANPTDSWYNANHENSFKLVLPPTFDYKLNVESVAADNDSNAPVEYYNLQGIRVANPRSGSIYIKRQGNKATKVRL